LLHAVGGVAEGSTFVDLGSGTGRVALGVALAFPLTKLVLGYEVSASSLPSSSLSQYIYIDR